MKKLYSLIFATASLLSLNLAAEQTLSIIKPDAVKMRAIGDVISYFEDEEMDIVAIKITKLTKDAAARFYAEHSDKPYFQDLITFVSSGPIVAIVLDGNDVIARNRKIMGATDPNKAAEDTIREMFGTSILHNAVHGSDSAQSATKEIAFFFKPDEIRSVTK